MNKSDSIANLAEALSKAQNEFGQIEKNITVRVRMKSGDYYNFKYADLGQIVSKTKAALSNNGLSISQGVTDGPNVDTLLLHSSGEWIRNTTPIVGHPSGMQDMGALITYARRYGLTTILNVVSDEDEDANTVSEKTSSFEVKNNNNGNKPKSNELNPNPNSSKTNKPAGANSLNERISKMIMAFKDIGITEKQIESKAELALTQFRDENIEAMQTIYNSIKSGKTKKEDWFAMKNPLDNKLGEMASKL